MKTRRRVKRDFVDAGDTFAAWAKRRGYQKRTVYAVMSGQLKATRGVSHKIAVDLGLKQGAAPLP
jgi:gp16 family phage-associated protein